MKKYLAKKSVHLIFSILLLFTSCEWYKKGVIVNDSKQLPFKGFIALLNFDDPRYLSHTQTGEKDQWALALTDAEGKRIYIINFSMYSGEIKDSFCINPEPEPRGNCPSLLWTGTDFIMVYVTMINDEVSLRFVRFDEDGKILNQAELVNEDGTKIIHSFSQISLAKNQNTYALGLTGSNIRIVLFEENNSNMAPIKIKREYIVDNASGSNPSLLWNHIDGEYAFAWKTQKGEFLFQCFNADLSQRIYSYSEGNSENGFSFNWDFNSDIYYLARLNKKRGQISLQSFIRPTGLFKEESTIQYHREPQYLSLAFNGVDFSIIWCEKNDNHINYAY